MKQNACDMTKHLSYVLSLLLCSAALWTACSSDDDDDNGDGGGASVLETGVYKGEDGVVTSVLVGYPLCRYGISRRCRCVGILTNPFLLITKCQLMHLEFK